MAFWLDVFSHACRVIATHFYWHNLDEIAQLPHVYWNLLCCSRVLDLQRTGGDKSQILKPYFFCAWMWTHLLWRSARVSLWMYSLVFFCLYANANCSMCDGATVLSPSVLSMQVFPFISTHLCVCSVDVGVQCRCLCGEEGGNLPPGLSLSPGLGFRGP